MSDAICHPKWCMLIKGPPNSKCMSPCINFDKPNPLKYPMCDWYCKYHACYDPNPDYIELYDALREELGSRDQAIRFLKRIHNGLGIYKNFNPDGFPEYLLPKAYELREKLESSPLVHNIDLPLQYDSGLVSTWWTVTNIFSRDENGKLHVLW